MNKILVSIIIPTHNRQRQIIDTVTALLNQSVSSDCYEIIVVDDGSTPPVGISIDDNSTMFKIIRLNGVERSEARNSGALISKGELLIFVDDDVEVNRTFIKEHLNAHKDDGNTLAVGKIDLPALSLNTSFGRFRQALERIGVPKHSGIVHEKNFCTAQNMSIRRERFFLLNGFDENLNSGEDQDFALRHTETGGQILYLPEAVGIHHDTALDIRSYCRRSEWGSMFVEKFCRKHPEFADNIERERINGYVRFGKEPLSLSVNKIIKSFLSLKPIVSLIFLIASVLERFAPNSYLLTRFYQLLLGLHIFRGYRKALRQNKNAN